MSKDLKEWMEGYEKYKDEDTEERRRAERRKLSSMKKGEWLEKQLRTGTSHILTIAPQGGKEVAGVPEEELPSALAEGIDALLAQIAEAAVDAMKDFIQELVEETKEVFQDTIKEVTSVIADAVENLADALTKAIKEIKGEEVEEEEEELPPSPEEGVAEEGAVTPEAAPTAPPAPPAEVPPAAPAPATAPTEERTSATAALAKSIGALISSELTERSEKEQVESPVPYLRATEEYFSSLKDSELGKAIEIIRNALVRRFDVRISPQGEVQLQEEKKE